MYFVIMNVCTAFRLISELQSIGNKQIFHLLLRQIGSVRKHHKVKLTIFFCSDRNSFYRKVSLYDGVSFTVKNPTNIKHHFV